MSPQPSRESAAVAPISCLTFSTAEARRTCAGSGGRVTERSPCNYCRPPNNDRMAAGILGHTEMYKNCGRIMLLIIEGLDCVQRLGTVVVTGAHR